MNDKRHYIKQEQVSEYGPDPFSGVQDESVSLKQENFPPETFNPSELRGSERQDLAMPEMYSYSNLSGAGVAISGENYGPYGNLYMLEGQMMNPMNFYEGNPSLQSLRCQPLMQNQNLPGLNQNPNQNLGLGNEYPLNTPSLNNPLNLGEYGMESFEDAKKEPETDEKQEKKPRAKSSHNIIEQRYRNKMNKQFQVLRDSVPVLREYNRGSQPNEDETHIEESGPGIAPVTKLNKGIILAKSIEYIQYLESKNQSKMMEYQQLVERAQMLGYEVDQD